MPTFVKEEEVKKSGLMDEEKHLYSLSHHAGWKILEKYSQELLNDLDQVTNLALTQGLELEEIGKNAVVANLAKGIIKRILQKVEDSVESVEKNNAK